MYISRKTLHKPDQLSEQEFDRIKSHTVLGAELCQVCWYPGYLPWWLVLKHHLKYDLSGYPRLPLLRSSISLLPLSPSAMFMMPFRKGEVITGLFPDVVYNIMNRDKGSYLTRSCWISFLSLWASGDWRSSRIKWWEIALVKRSKWIRYPQGPKLK